MGVEDPAGLAIDTVCWRVLGELHKDFSYLMMGKDAWVAGADRREAPGLKPERLGRRLRLRYQPPRSWQLLNGGDQRAVSFVAQTIPVERRRPTMTPHMLNDNDRRGPNHRRFDIFITFVVSLLTMMVPAAAPGKTRGGRSRRWRS